MFFNAINCKKSLISITTYGRILFTNCHVSWDTLYLRVDNTRYLGVDSSRYLRVDNTRYLRVDNTSYLRVDNIRYLRVDNNRYLRVDNTRHLRVDNTKYLRVDDNNHLGGGEYNKKADIVFCGFKYSFNINEIKVFMFRKITSVTPKMN